MNKTKDTQKNTKESLKTKKTTVKRTKEVEKEVFPASVNCSDICKNNFFNTGIIVILIILIMGGLAFTFKDKWVDKLVVATVNGRPVFRQELNQRMASIYGKDTLENLILERLVSDEAAKNKIIVSEDEVNEEIDKISASLGEGTKIEDILALQGMTMKSLREQLKLKLQVDKLLGKEINITDEEISRYITDNTNTLVASDEAGRKEEAKSVLFDQKVDEKARTWIGGLENDNVTRYLK